MTFVMLLLLSLAAAAQVTSGEEILEKLERAKNRANAEYEKSNRQNTSSGNISGMSAAGHSGETGGSARPAATPNRTANYTQRRNAARGQNSGANAVVTENINQAGDPPKNATSQLMGVYKSSKMASEAANSGEYEASKELAEGAFYTLDDPKKLFDPVLPSNPRSRSKSEWETYLRNAEDMYSRVLQNSTQRVMEGANMYFREKFGREIYLDPAKVQEALKRGPSAVKEYISEVNRANMTSYKETTAAEAQKSKVSVGINNAEAERVKKALEGLNVIRGYVDEYCEECSVETR